MRRRGVQCGKCTYNALVLNVDEALELPEGGLGLEDDRPTVVVRVHVNLDIILDKTRVKLKAKAHMGKHSR